MVRTPLILALLTSACAALAHDPGLSTTQITFGSSGLDVEVGYAPADLRPLLGVNGKADPNWTQKYFETVEPQLLALAPQFWRIGSSGQSLKPDAVRAELTASNTVSFQLHYPTPAGGPLLIESGVMEKLPPGHRDFLSADDEHGGLLLERLVDAQSGKISLR
jgi:hypothetical protein